MAYPTHVTLTVRHPSLGAGTISQLLQMKPDVKHTAGERVRSPIPSAPEELCDTTLWSRVIMSPDGKGIIKLAEEVLSKLEERSAGLHDIWQTGGSVVLEVPVDSDEQKQLVEEALASAPLTSPVDVRVERWIHPHARLD